MSNSIHFYLTFNPHKNDYMDNNYTQAHEFFELLQKEVKKSKDSYAYWGKIIGKDRESSFDVDQFNQIINKNESQSKSTHLYISDFKNLWVAKVVEVKKGIGKDKNKTLSFYEGKNVEMWFKITDFTLLEYCYEATANKLSELYIDNDYMDLTIDEISPFTTAIKYPAFVQDLAEEYYFDEIDEGQTHLILQDNFAINNIGTNKVIQTLQTFAFPEAMYSKIPHSAKMEIEAAEIDMLENRHHNLKKVAFSYIKAFEIIVNHLTIHHLKKEGLGEAFFVNPHTMPPRLYLFEHEDNECVPLSKFQKNYSITQLIYFMQRAVKSNRLDFAKVFSKKKQFLRFLTKDLSKILEENQMMNIRGTLAHNDSTNVSESDALAIRNIVLGVGCKGLIHELYQSFYPEDFKSVAQVCGNYERESETLKKESRAKKHLKIA